MGSPVVSTRNVPTEPSLRPRRSWRGLDAVEPLEQKLGKTVISVNQATIWLALRRIGWTEPIQGFGSLLRKLV